jgi:hypothetical protein
MGAWKLSSACASLIQYPRISHRRALLFDSLKKQTKRLLQLTSSFIGDNRWRFGYLAVNGLLRVSSSKVFHSSIPVCV